MQASWEMHLEQQQIQCLFLISVAHHLAGFENCWCYYGAYIQQDKDCGTLLWSSPYFDHGVSY